MRENTKIEWTDHSWSPWRGCTKVSAGCANCYAETLSKRNPAVLGQWGKGKPRVLAKNWEDPVRWNRKPSVCEKCGRCSDRRFDHSCTGRPEDARHTSHVSWHRATVFPSLCDWLDDEVPIEWLARFLKLIHDTPNLMWLLLTKRPENFRARLSEVAKCRDIPGDHSGSWLALGWGSGGTIPLNVWIGTSVEDQENADRRIPELLKIPAAGRFLSLEPLLGPVDLWGARYRRPNGVQAGAVSSWRPSIDWVILGGESGPGSRPCNIEWIRRPLEDCKAAGVPAFVKQLGSMSVTQHPMEVGSLIQCKTAHPKGGDPNEWPVDLLVRKIPEGLL